MPSVISLLLVGTPAVIVLAGILILWHSYGRREMEGSLQLAEAKETGRHIPVSLHPVVDPNACMCSGACVEVCPEDGVLQIVNGTARLVNASACIGHGLCETACPVQAIKLVFGSSQRGVQLPDLNPGFESSRPGVFVVGELGGMGLIKNAVRQGVQAVEHLAAALRNGAAKPGQVDVLIVGAGPAGLGAALACKQQNLTFRVVDQNTVGGSIASYPRQKVVMSERVDLPIYGTFGNDSISKEELLAGFDEALKMAKVKVEEKVRVEKIDGTDNNFTVLSNVDPIPCRKVILALGRRGTPRMLEVPGEVAANVTYQLADPTQYNNTRVLVVGGGDSAIETAVMLATESNARVSISYRGKTFARAKKANIDRVQHLIADGRIKAFLRSEVKGVSSDMVRLEQDGRRFVLRTEYVIVQIGGSLPDKLLEALGIRTSLHTGKQAVSSPAIKIVTPRGPGHTVPVSYPSLAKSLSIAFTCVSVMAFIALAWYGRHYYPLSRAQRIQSQLHPVLRPSGGMAQGIGIVATSVMMFNFAYAVRKRFKKLRNFGNLADWLDLHMLVGVITPLFVSFHAAFQSNNVLATTTSLSLAIVVITGIFGRFLFGLVPTEGDDPVAIDELIAEWESLRQAIELESVALQLSGEFHRLSSTFYMPPSRSESVGGGFLSLIQELVSVQFKLWRTKKHFNNRSVYLHFRSEAFRLTRMRLQIGAYEPLRRLLAIWRVFHIVLSCLLVVIISAHIGVSLYLGYGRAFF